MIKKRMTPILLATLAMLAAGLVLLATGFVNSQATPPPPPTDADLEEAGYRVKEPPGPPAVAREQAIDSARSFLDSIMGPTRGQRIHGRPAATRHVLLSEDPNLVNHPAWIVAFHDISSDDLPMPCGGPAAIKGRDVWLECPTKALYVVVDATTPEDVIGFTTVGRVVEHPRQ